MQEINIPNSPYTIQISYNDTNIIASSVCGGIYIKLYIYSNYLVIGSFMRSKTCKPGVGKIALYALMMHVHNKHPKINKIVIEVTSELTSLERLTKYAPPSSYTRADILRELDLEYPSADFDRNNDVYDLLQRYRCTSSLVRYYESTFGFVAEFDRTDPDFVSMSTSMSQFLTLNHELCNHEHFMY